MGPLHTMRLVLAVLFCSEAFAQDLNDASSTLTSPPPSLSTNTWVNITSQPASSRYESALRCNSIKSHWQDINGTAFASNSTFRTFSTSLVYTEVTSTLDSTSFLSSSNPHVYTLCDGWPRIDEEIFSTKSSTTRLLSTHTEYFTTTSAVYTKVPMPSCTIPGDICSSMKGAYSSSMESLHGLTPTKPPYPIYPICGPPKLYEEGEAGDPVCAIGDATVQLLYWEVERTTGLCDSPRPAPVTAPPVPTNPATFVTLNTTLTSPTVYIVLNGTYMDYGTDTALHTTILVVPQDATAVSSYPYSTGLSRGSPERVDYADSDNPVPASKYRAQYKCFNSDAMEPDRYTTISEPSGNYTSEYSKPPYSGNFCSTIYAGGYAPVLSIPLEIRSMSGLFAGCQIDWNEPSFAFFDPPKRLTHVSSIQSATLPGQHLTSTTSAAVPASPSAEPVNTVVPATPTATRSAKATSAKPASEASGTPSNNQPSQSSSTSKQDLASAVASIFSAATEAAPNPKPSSQARDGIHSSDEHHSSHSYAITFDPASRTDVTPESTSHAGDSPASTYSQAPGSQTAGSAHSTKQAAGPKPSTTSTTSTRNMGDIIASIFSLAHPKPSTSSSYLEDPVSQTGYSTASMAASTSNGLPVYEPPHITQIPETSGSVQSSVSVQGPEYTDSETRTSSAAANSPPAAQGTSVMSATPENSATHSNGPLSSPSAPLAGQMGSGSSRNSVTRGSLSLMGSFFIGWLLFI